MKIEFALKRQHHFELARGSKKRSFFDCLSEQHQEHELGSILGLLGSILGPFWGSPGTPNRDILVTVFLVKKQSNGV